MTYCCLSGKIVEVNRKTENTIKTGTEERLKNREWVSEVKLSCSIFKLRKIMVLWFLVELSYKTPWHNMQANHNFLRNTKRSWQFWCWYKWQGLRWEGLVICKSAPIWQKSNCRNKAFKHKRGCRLGKEVAPHLGTGTPNAGSRKVLLSR